MTRLRNVQRKRRNWRRVKARAVRILHEIFGVPEPPAYYQGLTPETVADWADSSSTVPVNIREGLDKHIWREEIEPPQVPKMRGLTAMELFALRDRAKERGHDA